MQLNISLPKKALDENNFNACLLQMTPFFKPRLDSNLRL